MKLNVGCALAVCGLLTLSVGCQQGNVVRGQNALAYHDGMMHSDMAGQMQMPGNGMTMGPMYYDGPAWGYNDCQACPTGDVWRPTHHHTWEYNPPTNLVYPPANQLPAVVQYPYYTVKGPSDFFMK